MKIRTSCQDKYEAQKLASLVFLKDGNQSFITEILNIVEDELIVALKDKSAHSIMLKNTSQAEMLADFLQSVMEKKHNITDAVIFGADVEIIKL